MLNNNAYYLCTLLALLAIEAVADPILRITPDKRGDRISGVAMVSMNKELYIITDQHNLLKRNKLKGSTYTLHSLSTIQNNIQWRKNLNELFDPKSATLGLDTKPLHPVWHMTTNKDSLILLTNASIPNEPKPSMIYVLDLEGDVILQKPLKVNNTNPSIVGWGIVSISTISDKLIVSHSGGVEVLYSKDLSSFASWGLSKASPDTIYSITTTRAAHDNIFVLGSTIRISADYKASIWIKKLLLKPEISLVEEVDLGPVPNAFNTLSFNMLTIGDKLVVVGVNDTSDRMACGFPKDQLTAMSCEVVELPSEIFKQHSKELQLSLVKPGIIETKNGYAWDISTNYNGDLIGETSENHTKVQSLASYLDARPDIRSENLFSGNDTDIFVLARDRLFFDGHSYTFLELYKLSK